MANRPKVPNGWYSNDVAWLAPKRKKPIAYSTKGASDLIVALSEKYETIIDVHNAIMYDQEAKKVLNKFIELGHGDLIARQLFG